MIRNEIEKYFCLKEEYIGDPGQCLGRNLREVALETEQGHGILTPSSASRLQLKFWLTNWQNETKS